MEDLILGWECLRKRCRRCEISVREGGGAEEHPLTRAELCSERECERSDLCLPANMLAGEGRRRSGSGEIGGSQDSVEGVSLQEHGYLGTRDM